MELLKIITKLMNKNMLMQIFRHREGFKDNKPNQLFYRYCIEHDLRKRATDYLERKVGHWVKLKRYLNFIINNMFKKL